MNHLQKKSAVNTYGKLHAEGKSEEQVKEAIKADDREFSEEQVEEIYKEIVNTVTPDPNAATEEEKKAEQPAEEHEEKEAPEEPKKSTKAAAKPKATKQTTQEKSKSATKKSEVDKVYLDEGEEGWPDEVKNAKPNANGYIVCSQYKGAVRVGKKSNRELWEKKELIEANIKLSPIDFFRLNKRCVHAHPIFFLPEVIDRKELIAEQDKD